MLVHPTPLPGAPADAPALRTRDADRTQQAILRAAMDEFSAKAWAVRESMRSPSVPVSTSA